MFEQQNQSGVPPVQDIFADTEKNSAPFTPNVTTMPIDRVVAVAPAGLNPKKWFFIGGSIAIMLILGLGYWWLSRPLAAPQTYEPPREVTPPTSTQTPPPTDNTAVVPPPPPAPIAMDTDADGLIDNEERTLGTALDKADTDADGLTDREEVQVYRTDPLNIDSDGDGYNDGREVHNGYSPKGPGKLLELPTQ